MRRGDFNESQLKQRLRPGRTLLKPAEPAHSRRRPTHKIGEPLFCASCNTLGRFAFFKFVPKVPAAQSKHALEAMN
jgi:hypothetical protein